MYYIDFTRVREIISLAKENIRVEIHRVELNNQLDLEDKEKFRAIQSLIESKIELEELKKENEELKRPPDLKKVISSMYPKAPTLSDVLNSVLSATPL